MQRTALIVTIAFGLTSGCYDPNFQQGVPCTAERVCPEGQICHTDDRCYSPDQIPDASVAPLLTQLEVSAGELVPPFDPQVHEYTLDLGLGADQLTVTATAEEPSTTITIAGAAVSDGLAATVPLNLGPNTITIEVDLGSAITTYELAVDRGAGVLQRIYAKASNTDAVDNFGSSLAVSGDTLAVAAHLEDSASGTDQSDNSAVAAGAVYVFVRSGSTWTQQAYLKGSNTEADDFFGSSVAISGDTLAIGARFEASATSANEDDNSTPGSGAVYVFVRNGSTWTQQAYIKSGNADVGDLFGASVALSGDTLAVGAPSERSAASGVGADQNDDSAPGAGAAYIFFRTGVSWSRQAYIKASNTDASDNFGTSVALEGDTLAVGAPREGSAATGVNGNESDNSAPGAGAVYLFVRNGTAWTQQAYIKASNTETEDRFGASVALSGETLAVGAPGEGSAEIGVGGDESNNSAPQSGAVYVFVQNGADWSQEAYLKASNTGASDEFGSRVAISGDALAAAAPLEDSATPGIGGDQGNNDAAESGAVYLFTRNAGSWSQRAYIKGTETEARDNFGAGLSLSGPVLAVGANGEDGAATGVGGNEADNNAGGSGAAYIFE